MENGYTIRKKANGINYFNFENGKIELGTIRLTTRQR